MKVRAVKPFRWAGEHVEPGTLLDVTSREAVQLVHAYKDCVYADESDAPSPQSAMVVNADPVIQSRDPVAGAAPRRRRP